MCDDDGMISDRPVEPGSPGTVLEPGLTYLGLLNNLRGHTGFPPVAAPLQCTGSAHLAGEEFHCTSPAHQTRALVGSAPGKIQVTATDLDAPHETSTVEILDDYVIVTAGTAEVTSVVAHANGTHVITVKGVKR
jgi:hypothetical protein